MREPLVDKVQAPGAELAALEREAQMQLALAQRRLDPLALVDAQHDTLIPERLPSRVVVASALGEQPADRVVPPDHTELLLPWLVGLDGMAESDVHTLAVFLMDDRQKKIIRDIAGSRNPAELAASTRPNVLPRNEVAMPDPHIGRLDGEPEALLAEQKRVLNPGAPQVLQMLLLSQTPLAVEELRPLQRQRALAGKRLHVLALFGRKGVIADKSNSDTSDHAVAQ